VFLKFRLDALIWPDFALVLISRVWLQARIFHLWSETICLNINIYRCILHIYKKYIQSVWQEVYHMCTSWQHRHANNNVGLVLLWISPVNSWVLFFGVQVWWRWVGSDLFQLALLICDLQWSILNWLISTLQRSLVVFGF
jgi:hypothetical protein